MDEKGKKADCRYYLAVLLADDGDVGSQLHERLADDCIRFLVGAREGRRVAFNLYIPVGHIL